MNNEKLEEIKKSDSVFVTLMKGTLNGVIVDNQDKFDEAFEKTLATYKSLKIDSMFSDEEINDIKEWLRTEITIRDSQAENNTEGSEEDNSGDIIAGTDSSNLSWFPEFKSKNKLPLWNRYERYLKEDKGWADKNIKNLDVATDNILNLLGNPNSKESFDRRGLIMGDVQSGKTANYTAICNKAVDAGYNVIIVLTGIQEDLRKQTQERLNKELVGLNDEGQLFGVASTSHSFKDKTLSWKFKRFTKGDSDFKEINDSGNIVININNSVLLFVTKKNKTILEKIIDNLKSLIKDGKDCDINLSLLLVDDEADSASIDTNAGQSPIYTIENIENEEINNKNSDNDTGEIDSDEEDDIDDVNVIKKQDIDPSAINACIRDILKLFDKKTYLGITATPFANCFINPDANTEKHDADIFPKDFIYVLDAPENYIGAEKIFGDNGKYKNMIITKEDMVITESKTSKPKVKQNNRVQKEYYAKLTTELKESVYYFMLVNAIRDYREDLTEHRSMIINVSHLKYLHENLSGKLKPKIDEIKSDLENFSSEESHIAEERSAHIKELHKIFDKYKDGWDNVGELTWDNLLHNYLFKAIKPIELKVINSKMPEKLDFDRKIHPEGVRVIVIGGYSLSRGLTLEGLCVTFFERNSNAYDTLLQMGRWFGYRPRYADLCKIWMSEELISWYSNITSDVSELKKDIKTLQTLGKSPMEVAVKIRTSSARLSVTATNKLGTAKRISLPINWSKELIGAARFKIADSTFKANEKLINNFIKSLNATKAENQRNGFFWKDIPKEDIAKLVLEFKTIFYKFPNQDINEYILTKMDYKNWDVFIPEGEAKKQEIPCGLMMKPMDRKVYIINGNQIEIAGGNSRLGAGGIAKKGLTEKQIKEIEYRFTYKDKKIFLTENI